MPGVQHPRRHDLAHVSESNPTNVHVTSHASVRYTEA
jgi:hypothetical protein